MYWSVARRWGRVPATLVIGAIAVTAAVAGIEQVRFAYQNLALHLALETTEGMVLGLVVVLLALGWRGTEGAPRHFSGALGLLVAANLALTVIPITVLQRRPDGLLAWAPATLRLGAAVLLVLSCVRVSSRWLDRHGPGIELGVLVLALSLAGALALLDGSPVDDRLSRSGSGHPEFDVAPALTLIQLLVAVAYGLTALRIDRSAVAESSPEWFGAGFALLAISRVHYALYPSLSTELVYPGDVIRAAGYCCFLVAAIAVLRTSADERIHLVRLHERSRMAADLHDGLVQELAYIRSQTSGRTELDAGALVPVADAATRALDEARLLVATFDALVTEDVAEAVRRCADSVTVRAGVVADVEVTGVTVPPQLADDVVRIVGEAATNAVRHGVGREVRIRVHADHDSVLVEVSNDGVPMEASSARSGFGLATMQRRAELHGGRLEIGSEHGWTTVRAVIPIGPDR